MMVTEDSLKDYMAEPGTGPSEAEVTQQPTTAETPLPAGTEVLADSTTPNSTSENPSPNADSANSEPRTKPDLTEVSDNQSPDNSQSPAFQLLSGLGAFDKNNPEATKEFSQKTPAQLEDDLKQLTEMYADDPQKVNQIKRYFIAQILDPSASEGARTALLSQDIDALLQMKAAKQGVSNAEDENFDDVTRERLNKKEGQAGAVVDYDTSQTTETEARNRWLGKEDENGERHGGLIYEALATHLSGKELEVARQKLSQPGISPEEGIALLTGKDLNDEKQKAEVEEDVNRFKKAIAEYVGPHMFDLAFKHNDFSAFLDFLFTDRSYGFGGGAGEFSKNGEKNDGIGKTDFENLLKDDNPSRRQELGKNLEKAITDSGEKGLEWHGFQLANKEAVLQKARAGDAESIKLVFDQILRFLFDDSGKTMQRWGVARKILGENLFPSKQQPLSGEVANYLAQEFNKPHEEWWKSVLTQSNVKAFPQSNSLPQAKAA